MHSISCNADYDDDMLRVGALAARANISFKAVIAPTGRHSVQCCHVHLRLDEETVYLSRRGYQRYVHTRVHSTSQK